MGSTGRRLGRLLEAARGDLERGAALWVFVEEQRQARPGASAWDATTGGSLGRGEVSDPVAAQVLAELDFVQEEALDRRAMHAYLEALQRLRRARQALGGRVPAVDAALRAHDIGVKRGKPELGVGPGGRAGTSGVSLEEADRLRRRAVEGERACLCCDLGRSVVGKLKSGLCPADYRAWLRAGLPDRGPWIAGQRRVLEERLAAPGPGPRRGWMPRVVA